MSQIAVLFILLLQVTKNNYVLDSQKVKFNSIIYLFTIGMLVFFSTSSYGYAEDGTSELPNGLVPDIMNG